MANSAQARKRARQNTDRRLRNASQRSALRTAIKRVRNAVQNADREAATAAYRAAVPLIDRGARRGLIKKNTAARYKSRLNQRIRAVG
ncbi:MAG: 30S ribosomal protein S20 [Pseudomonadota bacterium]|nr:30S ribosomal protein S20 [Pseudomonadota bacterium]